MVNKNINHKRTWNGYTLIHKTDIPEKFWPMIPKNEWIFEHRLVMAIHLNRLLMPNEDIHHINYNKKDNRIENLKLMSYDEHRQLHKEKDRL